MLLLLLLLMVWSLLLLLMLLLLWLLLLRRWRRCRPALRLSAAALQQVLAGGGPVDPAATHPDRCMQQPPAKHPQLPRQALVADVTVRSPPGRVPVACLLPPPEKRVLKKKAGPVCHPLQVLSPAGAAAAVAEL